MFQLLRSYTQPPRTTIYNGKNSNLTVKTEPSESKQPLKSSIYILPNKEDMDRFKVSDNRKNSEVPRTQQIVKSSKILETAY